MPGVPSGRACDGCRKQKKKCDERQPTCSRCLRLGQTCIGSGVQRYKWQGQTDCVKVLVKQKHVSPSTTMISTPSRSPSSETLSLATRFTRVIDGRTDVRFNLEFMYGDFVNDVPSRLGANAALDAVAALFINAHSEVCTGSRQVSVRTISLYSTALASLRTSLGSYESASSTETLCAITLLLLCQGFIGQDGPHYSRHSEGARQILIARGQANEQDPFETKLLTTLRSPLLFEGLVNPKMVLAPEEWPLVMGNSSEICDMRTIVCLSTLVHYRVEEDTFDDSFTSSLATVREAYIATKDALVGLRDLVAAVDPNVTGMAAPSTLSSFLPETGHAYHQRNLGIALFMLIVQNCVLQRYDEDIADLEQEACDFSTEVFGIAKKAQCYRPLGASYALLCLMAAYMGMNDAVTRTEILALYTDYRRDFPGEQSADEDEIEIRKIYNQLRLGLVG